MLEREVAGFGASGRNGGWCSALFPASVGWLAKRYGEQPAVAQHRAMQDSVDEVGRAAAAEDIDCGFTKGGTVTVARTPLQLARAREQVAEARRWGFGEQDLALLDHVEAGGRLNASDVLGATYTPHCAAIHPARLVRGLARAVERRGVALHERTPVTRIEPGLVTTTQGTVRAEVVIRATEGFTAQLPGLRRTLAPVYSLMVATEPLTADVWDRVGLRDRETFADHRHLVIYGQRTADDRLAFGGRGAPYHFGSGIRPEHDREPAVFRRCTGCWWTCCRPSRALRSRTRGAGPWASLATGAPRSAWTRPPDSAGPGGTSGTASRRRTSRGGPLPTWSWVGTPTSCGCPGSTTGRRSWEPEPLRWVGVSASLAMMTRADAEEARTGRPSRRAPDEPGPRPLMSSAPAPMDRPTGCASSAAATSAGHPSPRW